MYKKDLTTNDLQWLICPKTKQTQTNEFNYHIHCLLVDF